MATRRRKTCKYGRRPDGLCRLHHNRRPGYAGFGADFQRRHYTAIAKILRDNGIHGRACESFVHLFQADNPQFKAGLFRSAAGC